jgi:hypothetical protein
VLFRSGSKGDVGGVNRRVAKVHTLLFTFLGHEGGRRDTERGHVQATKQA